MKKGFKILCASLLLFGLVGCSSNKNNDNPVDPIVDSWVTDDDDTAYAKLRVSSLSISDSHSYVCGDKYGSVNELHVTVTYNDGTTRKLAYSKLQMVYITRNKTTYKDSDVLTEVGEYSVQVKYSNVKSNTIAINVVSNVSTLTISDSKSYHVGDVYSKVNELTAVGTYTSGDNFTASYDKLTSVTCTYGTTSNIQDVTTGFGVAGTYTLTANYQGKDSNSITINVLDYDVSLSGKAQIKFGGATGTGGYTKLDGVIGNLTTTNEYVSISTASCQNVFGGSGAGTLARNALRIGSSTKGYLTLEFSDYYLISKVSLIVRGYEKAKSSAASVTVTTDSETTGVKASVTNFNSVASITVDGLDATKSTKTLTIATPDDGAVYLYGLAFDFEDTYPTQISTDSTLAIAVNNHKTLSVTFADNVTKREVNWSSSDNSICTVADGVVTGVAEGSAKITVSSAYDSSVSATCDVTVTALTEVTTKTELKYDYEDFNDNFMYNTDICPAEGNAKLLVIPVWFTDSENYISLSTRDSIKEKIQKAYFGTNEETGWRSVSSYYYEESFGKVNIGGTVTDWYECGNKSSSYSSSAGTANLVLEAVSWYKNLTGSNLLDYDSDGDGFIDGVMLIYGAPDYSYSGDSNTNLWAYCYWCQNEDLRDTTNPGANQFFWASYDFMKESGDTSHCIIDTHTYIHEMGHVFGLEDYYDYNGRNYAAGCFSMQDYNVGTHDPFSKVALGWEDPYVVTEASTVTIGPNVTTGDVVLVKPNYTNSPFDEYLLLELYTPTGLNEFDSTYQYQGSYPKGPSTAGIRIWHVDARLMYSNSDFGWDFSDKRVTNEFIGDGIYGFDFVNTNTTYLGNGDEDGRATPIESFRSYKQLQLLQHDGETGFTFSSPFEASDMWQTGDTFSIEEFSSSFVKTTLNDGTEFNFEIVFNSVSADSATISIIYK